MDWDAEELRRLYVDERLSTLQIAAHFGVTFSTVNRHLRRFDIPLRVVGRQSGKPGRIIPREEAVSRGLKHRRPLPDADELRRLYWVDGLCTEEIAERFNVSPPTVLYRFRAYGIPTRSRKEARANARAAGHFGTGTRAIWQRIVFDQEKRPRTCVRCRSRRKIIVHHRDEDRTNNASDNLEVLCSRCHALHHNARNRLPLDGGWSKRRP